MTEAFQSGLLNVADRNRIYWETSGAPRGKPALYLHCGPESCAQFRAGLEGALRRSMRLLMEEGQKL